MHVLKPLHAQVSIELGGRQGNMTEQFLHRAEVGASFEQVCREGVPKRVG